MKIVALVGSNRQQSYNKKLTFFIKDRYKDKVDVEILPIEKLPFFNQDDELTPPAIVLELRKKIVESDGILIATPEYNHSIPGFLKNALDWFSRAEKVFVKKPVMIVGASGGVLGTARAQMHLRQILNSPGIGALTLPGNEVFVGAIQDKMDANGKIIHEPTVQFIDGVMAAFIDWAEKTKML